MDKDEAIAGPSSQGEPEKSRANTSIVRSDIARATSQPLQHSSRMEESRFRQLERIHNVTLRIQLGADEQR